VTTLEHPPYSPDPTPADFYVSPRLTSALEGFFLVIPLAIKIRRRKSWKGFHKMASRNVPNTCRWQKCTFVQDGYFEENVA